MTVEELNQLHLALALGCGRSRSLTTKKRRQWFCFLTQVLAVEFDARGLGAPPPPYHAGDLHKPPRLAL